MSRIVLVTGASRGLGFAIAKMFLANNDIVYVHYNKTKEEALKLQAEYPTARLVKADLSNEEEIKSMIDIIKKDENNLDVIINNAGVAIDTTIDAKTKTNFLYTLDINLIAPFLIVKYAKDILKKGSIINISSTNGIDTYYPYSLDYDASKAGLISLTHNLAVELKPNVRVNTVAPGWINTDMNKELDEEFKKEECKHILLERFSKPEEIAKVVFFLASKDASYINNSIIRVDGGFYY